MGQGPQVAALRKGVDILIACPGRLEDLIKQGQGNLGGIEITIIDEADHMADLGFLPVVRRLLDQTPRDGQRMLFSATLDSQVDVLVKRFLTNAVVHEADSALSPVSTMTHHVLHVDRDQRLPVLVDLASAPGRTVVFTRTKHGAKALARQLNAKGIPTVDLHGNLSQGARTRNMDAFHSGKATTLVATDIAARGIHVDDVALVVHADPPVEHKAYTHRSGRTARAGSDGTVVTLATAEQLREVRSLTKAAGINPTTTRVQSMSDPVLTTVAPGARALPGGLEVPAAQAGSDGGGDASAQRRRRSSSRLGLGRRQGSGPGRRAAAVPGAPVPVAVGPRARPRRVAARPVRPVVAPRAGSGGGGGNSLAYSTSTSGGAHQQPLGRRLQHRSPLTPGSRPPSQPHTRGPSPGPDLRGWSAGGRLWSFRGPSAWPHVPEPRGGLLRRLGQAPGGVEAVERQVEARPGCGMSTARRAVAASRTLGSRRRRERAGSEVRARRGGG